MLQQLGIGGNTPIWVDHPRYDQGTFVNPFRRASNYETTSGWSSQISYNQPASHYGGAGVKRRKRKKGMRSESGGL